MSEKELPNLVCVSDRQAAWMVNEELKEKQKKKKSGKRVGKVYF